MNGMGTPLGAIIAGSAQGAQEAQRIAPNTYQAQGVSAPQNPWQGELDSISNRLIEISKQLKDQGQEFREYSDEFMGYAHDIAKCNSKLDKLITEGQENSNAY